MCMDGSDYNMNVNASPIILGIGTALPERVITNEELSARFKNDKFNSFLDVAGIRERRVIAPSQSAGDLAELAANALLDAVALDRNEIDAIIYRTQTPEYRIPSTACILQSRLGLSQRAMTFDMVQGCGSFIPEFATSASLLGSGIARNILAIHSDAFSQIINPMDQELVPIHGDGAVAILYKQGSVLTGSTIDWFEFGVDGKHAEHIIVPEGMSRSPLRPESLVEETFENGSIRAPSQLKMNGAAVFHFVVHTIPQFIKNACATHGTSLEEYDLVLFHQANKMMVSMLYGMLKIPKEKQFYFLEKVGNMSGVTLPFMLSEALKADRIREGSRVLLCGFGAGLSWGAVSLTWQSSPCVLPETAILRG